MNNEQLYGHCRATVKAVKSLRDLATAHQTLGEPVAILPIGDFFRTNNDLSVTYCDLVELYHYRDCAIRIGYIDRQIVKVRGMPLVHWTPPQETA